MDRHLAIIDDRPALAVGQSPAGLAQHEIGRGQVPVAGIGRDQAGIQSGRAKGIMMCWPCHIAKMSGRSGRTWS